MATRQPTVLPAPPVDPSIAADMPTTNRPMNDGSSMNDTASRLDGVAKVTGSAKYGRDVYVAGTLFVGYVRCPYGAATLESRNEDAARAVPGVVEVEISGDEGRYHGHKVGQIVADSHVALRRGMKALNCKWKKSPVKTRIADADPDLPEPRSSTREAMASADLTLEAVYTTPVQPHACLESHGASVDFKGERAVAYCSTQGTSAARDGMERALGLPASAIEVVCEYVGGGFGSKLNGAGPEGLTAGKVAAKHGRPAWVFCNRSEDQTDTGYRPSLRALVRIGFKKDGTIVGGEVLKWGGVGVGRGGGGASFPSGRYDLGDLDVKHKDVQHNGCGPRPARAPGSPQGAFVEELMLDEIAAAANVDPLDLRRRLVTDRVYREMMDMGAKLIGWNDRRPNGSQKTGLRIGYGLATGSWHSAGPGGSAEVVIHQDGSVQARTGTQDPGTGTRTAMGIVAADALGVPLKVVTVSIGHSGLPPGPGSGGSVVSPTIAPTMALAGEDAKQQLLEVVGQQLGADASELDIKGGDILRKGDKVMGWTDACSKLPSEGITGRNKGKADGGKGGTQAVQFVKLAVDSDTGTVHPLHVVAIQACGRVICRKTAESQIIGSVTQGVSNALFEQQVLDRNFGTMLNDNLESYKILGPADCPHIEPVLWTKGQTGVKSLGEPPIVPTSGAVACAVFNAVGRPVRDLPMTPDRILAAMEGGVS